MKNLKNSTSKIVKKGNCTRKTLNRIEGITLIALIITVIIMLILAGVAISTIAGEEGLFTRASRVAKEYENASKREAEILDEILNNEYMNNIVTDEEPGILAGTGTKEDPYLIESIEDLVAFSQAVAGGNKYEGQTVKMTVNLDFNSDNSYVNPLTEEYGDINGINGNEALKVELTTGSGFEPIGVNADNSFNGEFDGDNHILRNIYLNKKDEGVAGLFGYVKDGSISNIKVTGNIATNGVTNVGGIVASANGIKIEGVNNEINITSENGTDIKVGGIIGSDVDSSSKTEIVNSSNSGTVAVNSNGAELGGIQGYAIGTIKVSNCNNNGEIINKQKGENRDKSHIGGILGHAYWDEGKSNPSAFSVIIENSSNDKAMNIEALEGEAGDTCIGGIAGAVNPTMAKISNSHNVGDISTKNNEVSCVTLGGIVGGSSNQSIIVIENNSYNAGKLHVEISSVASSIGGIMAHNSSNDLTIRDSYNSGDIYVYCNSDISETGTRIGGIFGHGNSTSSTVIQNVYNLGKCEAISDGYNQTWIIGGIVGKCNNYSKISILDSYNLAEVNAKSTNESGEKRSNTFIMGGLLGNLTSSSSATIINSYNAKKISGLNNEKTSEVGGILGHITGACSYINMINCYNMGDVISDNVGMGIGMFSGTSVKVNNLYNAGNLEALSKYSIGLIAKDSYEIANVYYKDDGTPVTNLDSINKDETKVKPMSDENMRNQEFVKILNDNVDDIDLSNLDDDRVTEYSLKNWVFADNSYPTFE